MNVHQGVHHIFIYIYIFFVNLYTERFLCLSPLISLIRVFSLWLFSSFPFFLFWSFIQPPVDQSRYPSMESSSSSPSISQSPQLYLWAVRPKRLDDCLTDRPQPILFITPFSTYIPFTYIFFFYFESYSVVNTAQSSSRITFLALSQSQLSMRVVCIKRTATTMCMGACIT